MSWTNPDFNTPKVYKNLFVNVQESPFKARGDGVTDDTAAIQAAIDFVTNTGGELFFPAGTYLVSALTITDLSVVGGGLFTTRFLMRGVGHQTRIVGTAASVLLGIGTSGGNHLHDIEVRDMHLDGAGTSTSIIRILDSTRIILSRLRIFYSAGVGVYYGGSSGAQTSYGKHVIEKCLMRDNASHAIHVSDVVSTGNNMSITDNSILANGGAGVFLEAGFGYSITGNGIENNTEGGIILDSVGGVNIAGNYFEGHDGSATEKYRSNICCEATYEGINIVGNQMIVDDATSTAFGIYVEPSFGISIQGNSIQSASDHATNGTGVYFADGTHDVVDMGGNRIDTSLAYGWRYPATGKLNISNLTYALTLTMDVGSVGELDAYVMVPKKGRLVSVSSVVNSAGGLGGAVNETLTFANAGLNTIGTHVIPGSATRNSNVTTAFDITKATGTNNNFEANTRMRIRGSASNAALCNITITLTFIIGRGMN